MQPMQADQGRFLLESVYLPDLKNEYGLTKRVIAAIPADKGDYRPDEVSKSALDLGWHIASTEMRFMDALLTGEFDLSPRPRPDPIRSGEDVTRWYAENFEPRYARLAALSNEQILKIIPFRGVLQLPAVMYLNIMLHHSIHHRGQLSAYLRPMGAKVPSIYGESYDAAEARKAQQNG